MGKSVTKTGKSVTKTGKSVTKWCDKPSKIKASETLIIVFIIVFIIVPL